MTTWRYGLTRHGAFADPLVEIDALAALEEEGVTPNLLLAGRKGPPGRRAAVDDVLLLCVRHEGRYTVAARARVVGPAVLQTAPDQHEGLHPGAGEPGWWLPISIDKTTEEELGVDIDDLQGKGSQAAVWKLNKDSEPARSPNWVTPPVGSAIELPRLLLSLSTPASVLGVDLTAGDQATAFDEGRKKFWMVHLRTDRDGIKLTEPIRQASTLTELETELHERNADVVVIDGPCRANGIRLNPERNGWIVETPGFRSAERQLSQLGIKLFWTTEATLRAFPGAREWILRSLVLFERLDAGGASSTPARALETHPHAFFLLLWRGFGNGEPLRPKRTREGRRQRLALLRMFLDFDETLLPDDDAVDSMAAGLLGVLVQAGCAIPVGDEQRCGLIWIPDLAALKPCGRPGR